MSVAAILWWILIAAGLIPTSWFLWRFRPAWPIRTPSLIINGLVGVAWLTYIRSVFVIVAQGGEPTYRGTLDAVFSLGIGALVDAVLILLLIAFLKYRKRWQMEQEKGPGNEAG